MDSRQRLRHRWAVFLAGGDGIRLRSLTLRIAGDSRPKQFCCICGEQSLLNETRARVMPLFDKDRETIVVSRSHEQYYREDLSHTDGSLVIAQPLNRGTAIAMTMALLEISRADRDAVVAFFPCDHFYTNSDAFRLALEKGFDSVARFPESVLLVGAESRYPEVEYGWIEPESGAPPGPDAAVHRVRCFWEKPSLNRARTLLHRGCLWNEFVCIGRAGAFLDLLRARIPGILRSLEGGFATDDLETAYRAVPAVDFSREILTAQPNRLLVVRDRDSGWTDLGTPERVVEALTQNRVRPAWFAQAVECKLEGTNFEDRR
jgi:mannose-1-phosphate guanylyltransferase